LEDNDYVLAFDHFYTNNHIQILKSVLPFINAESASMLPVLIKYLELKYTMSLIGADNSQNPIGKVLHKANTNIHASNTESGNEPKMDTPFGNIENIYNAIRRYLAPNEDKSLSQLVNAVNTMKSVREMQAMMELLDINAGELGGNGFDINEIMKLFGGNMNGN
jgi:hypothetical protein